MTYLSGMADVRPPPLNDSDRSFARGEQVAKYSASSQPMALRHLEIENAKSLNRPSR